MSKMQEEIESYKEKLYLASLKVATHTMNEALEDDEFVSSGLLSASASLLKLQVQDVVKDNSRPEDLISAKLRELVKQDEDALSSKAKSIHYKEVTDE